MFFLVLLLFFFYYLELFQNAVFNYDAKNVFVSFFVEAEFCSPISSLVNYLILSVQINNCIGIVLFEFHNLFHIFKPFGKKANDFEVDFVNLSSDFIF